MNGISPIWTIILGMVSGILLTGLGLFSKNVLVPRIRAWISGELNISGIWVCQFTTPAGNAHNISLELQQRGRQLTGTMTVIKQLPGGKESQRKIFTASGEVKQRIVWLNGYNSDKKAFGAYASLFEVIGDAGTMKGATAWYSVTDTVIQSLQLNWTRESPSGIIIAR